MSKSCACKFLYGAETSRDEIGKLDNALDTQTEFKTEIIFYRKHGIRAQKAVIFSVVYSNYIRKYFHFRSVNLYTLSHPSSQRAERFEDIILWLNRAYYSIVKGLMCV